MADFRSLVISSGVTRQIGDGNRIIAPSGVISQGANLQLSTSSPGALAVEIGAGDGLICATGAGYFDFSTGTGQFKTTSGAVTVGPGAVTVSGATTFTNNVTFGDSANDRVSFAAQIGDATYGDLVFSNTLAAHTIKCAAVPLMSGPGRTVLYKGGDGYIATGVNPGGAGGAGIHYGGEGGAGTALQAAGAGGDAFYAGGKAGADNGGGGALGGDTHVRGGEGTGGVAHGSLYIGDTETTKIWLGSASGSVPIEQQAGGGAVTLTGTLQVSTIDANPTSTTLQIGTATATAITIGDTGVTTTIAGDLQVNGIETVVGSTTFQGDATFEGNVVFGNADTDTVSFFSVIGNGTYNDIVFAGTADHVIKAAPPASGSGKEVQYRGGDGYDATGVAPGGVGGLGLFFGGRGGDGTATQAPGAGGNTYVQGGEAGTDNGVGGSAGGHTYVDGGSSNTGVAPGSVYVGSLNTTKIWLGSASGSVPIEQQAGGGSVTLTGAVSMSAGLTLTGTGITMTGLDIGGSAAEIGDIYTDGFVRFAASSDPIAVIGKGYAYVKTVSGNPELFYRDPVNAPVQITSNGVVNAGSSTNAQKVIVSAVNREASALAVGEAVTIAYDSLSGNPGALRCDADSGTTYLGECAGLCNTAAASGASVDIVAAGEISVADAIWDSVPANTAAGSRVYISANPGKLTITAPSTSGNVVKKIGILTQGGSGACKVLVQVSDGVLL